MNKLKIIYQDQDFVAVYKPAGIAVHRSAISCNDNGYLLQIARNQIGQHLYPVHRLDKPVCGILIFALSHVMAQRLSAGFCSRQIKKNYLAVVRGHTETGGVINHPLSPDVYARKQGQTLKPAITCYERLAVTELPFAVSRYATSRYSLISISPITGRSHQIRRHLKHISHPVIGDSTYGDGRHNRFFREHFGCRRLLLASTELLLTHPRTGLGMRLLTPPDESLRNLFDQIGWSLGTGF